MTWRKDSIKHSLAAKGVKTKDKYFSPEPKRYKVGDKVLIGTQNTFNKGEWKEVTIKKLIYTDGILTHYEYKEIPGGFLVHDVETLKGAEAYNKKYNGKPVKIIRPQLLDNFFGGI
jgi:ribosomal protein L2